MNHEEREAYAARLMAVLQGDEPASMLTDPACRHRVIHAPPPARPRAHPSPPRRRP